MVHWLPYRNLLGRPVPGGTEFCRTHHTALVAGAAAEIRIIVGSAARIRRQCPGKCASRCVALPDGNISVREAAGWIDLTPRQLRNHNAIAIHCHVAGLMVFASARRLPAVQSLWPNSNDRSIFPDWGRCEYLTSRQASMASSKPGRYLPFAAFAAVAMQSLSRRNIASLGGCPVTAR